MNIRIITAIFVLSNYLGFAQSKAPSTLYFPNAFVYEVTTSRNEKQEIWIYHNPKNGLFLYIPNDEMLKGVLGNNNGNYKIFAQLEDGKTVFWSETIKKVVEKPVTNSFLKPNNKSKSTASTSQGQLISKGFTLSYLKTNEVDTLYLNTQIKGNANVLYGFSMLDGDAKLPNAFNLLGLVANNQFLAELHTPYSSIRLLTYESNPYWFETAKYKYIKK
ncbi:hypothetical protein GCM10027035_25990 [Emticicia sediminis]